MTLSGLKFPEAYAILLENAKEDILMNTYTNLNGREDLLASITALEQELAAKTGKEVSLVAYSPIRYASLNDDAEALAKITELEQLLSKKTGKEVALVAFTI